VHFELVRACTECSRHIFSYSFIISKISALIWYQKHFSRANSFLEIVNFLKESHFLVIFLEGVGLTIAGKNGAISKWRQFLPPKFWDESCLDMPRKNQNTNFDTLTQFHFVSSVRFVFIHTSYVQRCWTIGKKHKPTVAGENADTQSLCRELRQWLALHGDVLLWHVVWLLACSRG